MTSPLVAYADSTPASAAVPQPLVSYSFDDIDGTTIPNGGAGASPFDGVVSGTVQTL